MMKKTILSMMLLSGIMATSMKAQVTIGSTEDPAESAILDLNTGGNGNLGFLLPRVALASDTDASTVVNPATGLMVYADGTGGLAAGVYVWNGTSWQTSVTPNSGTLYVDDPVQSFSLNTPLSVERWSTGKFIASGFSPANATLPYARWRLVSGGSNISGVSTSLTEYTFTAEQTGMTEIMAISMDGNVSIDGTVTIWQNEVTDVTITNPNPLRLTIGNTAAALEAVVTPTDATRKALNWASLTPSVAAVSGSGSSWTVSGTAIGTTTLTASTTDDSNISRDVDCQVYPKINQPANISVTEGDAAQVLAVPTTTPAHTYQLSDFQITSSNSSVASYNSTNGELSFGSPGSATITVEFAGYNESQVTFTIAVASTCPNVIGTDGRCYSRSSATGPNTRKPTCSSGWECVSSIHTRVDPTKWIYGSVWVNCNATDALGVSVTPEKKWSQGGSSSSLPVACVRL
ncbi:MAG: hypothetical protein LBH61_05850 [Dysgonamonadaceae bacterium]|nr:hypothetical protein [Dysgonamonadaceae bacterium]